MLIVNDTIVLINDLSHIIFPLYSDVTISLSFFLSGQVLTSFSKK